MLSYWLTYGRVEYNLCVISYFPLISTIIVTFVKDALWNETKVDLCILPN